MAISYKTNYFRYQHYFLKAKKLYQKPITKASLSLILTLLTISFFSLFALKPTFLTIAKLIKELKDMKKVNQTLEKKIKNLNQAQTNYKKIKNDLIYLNNALPIKTEFNRFNQKITVLAFNHNLIVPSASFGEFELIPLATKDKSILKFKINVAGNFQDIKEFLTDLEKLDRLVEIDHALFSVKTNVPNAQMKAEINAQIFYFSNLDKEKNEKETY